MCFGVTETNSFQSIDTFTFTIPNGSTHSAVFIVASSKFVVVLGDVSLEEIQRVYSGFSNEAQQFNHRSNYGNTAKFTGDEFSIQVTSLAFIYTYGELNSIYLNLLLSRFLAISQSPFRTDAKFAPLQF